MKQLHDIGKYSHRSHVRAGAGTLNHQRRLRVALGIEGDDVVAASCHGDGMIARKLLDTRACATSRKRPYITKYGIMRARPLESSLHFIIEPCERRKEPFGESSAGKRRRHQGFNIDIGDI